MTNKTMPQESSFSPCTSCSTVASCESANNGAGSCLNPAGVALEAIGIKRPYPPEVAAIISPARLQMVLGGLAMPDPAAFMFHQGSLQSGSEA